MKKKRLVAKVNNVIFDLGGVIFDWDPDAILRAVFDDPEVQAHVKQTVFRHPDWAETDRGTLSRDDAIVRWARRTGLPVQAMGALMDETDRSMQPKRGTLQLMEELERRGLDLYCLSNMPAERYAYLRETYGIWDAFSGIVISAHVHMVKPEPGIYQYLLSAFSLQPENVIFVDDSPKNVAAARDLGIESILFSTAEECRPQLDSFLETYGQR